MTRMTLPLAADVTHGMQHLAALLDINQALVSTPNLRAALRRVFEIVEREHGIVRGAGLYVRRVKEDGAKGADRTKVQAEIRTIVDRVAPEGKLNAKTLSHLMLAVQTIANESPGDVDPLEILALVLEEYGLER